MNIKILSCALIFGLAFLANACSADEIVVGSGFDNRVPVGDFDCLTCNGQISNAFEFKKGQVSAGELWQFFNRQGIGSVTNLTICLDVEPEQKQASSPFSLASFEFKIEDPSNGRLITNAGFGNNSLVVPHYEISSLKPEARLEVALGYDFMTRFSANSRELVQFNIPEESASAAFSLEASEKPEESSSSVHFGLLAGFVGFWVMVFILLSRVTKTQLKAKPQRPAPAPRNRALPT